MLSQERYKLILEKLDKESVVYLNDLVKYLNTSESTIRRDLTALDKLGLLRKVHGGATSIKDINITTIDDKVENRQGLNINEKILIASNWYPANLVKGKLLKLNYSHIEYVLECMKKNTTKVKNIKKYMLAALFNAPTTMDGYYRAEVNHDMPQFA